MQQLTALPALVVSLVDDVPEPNDVKAGWLAFGIFILLILAVAFLGWSLVRQLRKVDAAEEAGLYDPSDKKPPVTIEQASEQGSGQGSAQKPGPSGADPA